MNRKLCLFFLVTLGFLRAATSSFSVEGQKCAMCVDLYTQYLPPWGGQGLHMASDAFPPQGVVELKTNVTFRGDPVPGKPVSYAIRAPNGETYSVTIFTQADGIAAFEFSLPGSEDYFGRWSVKASLDLAETTVSDTSHFLMGWLVEVVDVDAPPFVHKGSTMNLNVTLTRICVQDPRAIMDMLLKYPSGNPITSNDLLLYVTVTDELNQPVATSKLDTSIITELDVYDLVDFVATIGERWMDHVHVILTQYSEFANVAMNRIRISTQSFSGKATIHANLITNHPGIAYCPQGSGYVWITSQTDLDRNGKVNILDVALVASAFNSELGDSNWNPTADLNDDKEVNIFDVGIIGREWSKTTF